MYETKVTRQVLLKFFPCARPEPVEGYLRAHLEILNMFKTFKNSKKNARRNPSTSSGRARREYIFGIAM